MRSKLPYAGTTAKGIKRRPKSACAVVLHGDTGSEQNESRIFVPTIATTEMEAMIMGYSGAPTGTSVAHEPDSFRLLLAY